MWPKKKLQLQAQTTSSLDIDVLKLVGDCGSLSSGQWCICVLKNHPGLGWRAGGGAADEADQLGKCQISSGGRLGPTWTMTLGIEINGYIWEDLAELDGILRGKGRDPGEISMFLDVWWYQWLGQEAHREGVCKSVSWFLFGTCWICGSWEVCSSQCRGFYA